MVDLPLVTEPVFASLADAQPVAVADLHVLLVDGQPVFYPVAEILKADTAVVIKSIDDGTVLPAAQLFVHPHGHVVVIERDDGRDMMCHQFINQGIVKGDALGVHLAVRLRNDAGPGQRKTVAGESALRHESHIFLEVVVVVRRIGVIRKRFLGLGVQIDDGRRASAFRHSALHLPSRTGSAPHKIFGETGIVIVVHGTFLLMTVRRPCRRTGQQRFVRTYFLQLYHSILQNKNGVRCADPICTC